MAAYAALTSLMHIIHQIQHHPLPPISTDRQQAAALTEIVTSLQEFLETYHSPVADGDEADPLEMRIADAAYAAEDAIESHIADAIELRKSTITHHQEQGSNKKSKPMTCSAISYIGCLDLQRVIKDMDLVKKEAMEIITEEATVKAQLQRNVSARSSSIMVGFDDVLLEIMDKLIATQLHRQVIPIVGMAGIGKTTLAKHVYALPLINYHFDVCAWATISQNYDTREIFCELLSQANKSRSKEGLSNMSEDELGLAIHKHLFGRRFLIVMDDMWSLDAWNKIQHFLPNNQNSSRVVVTTRQSQLGSQLNNNYSLQMKFLDEVSSWDLFSKSAFGEESCPLDLEEIGKKIVENCRGLPLSIVVVGGLLKKIEHTKECWESIRKSSSSIVNSANEDFCFKILKMSYNHLPVYLKPCFLYMGVFEEDSAVRVSTLIKLWVSEGFLKPIMGQSLEATAKEYLKELVDRNLILVHELGSIGNIKYCKIHDLLRDLCWREAGKECFYTVIGQHKFEGLVSRQRCVVIPGSTSKEEVDDALQSMPLARSFVCHSKEVQPLPKWRQLRTLKAYDRDTSGSHNYRLIDLLRFVNSRYLAVGVHRLSDISSSIVLLWNLQTLVIFHSVEVYAPAEIWKMPQLRHIEFHKGNLHLPNSFGRNIVIMENLQTLKGVSYLKRDAVSKIIPNIMKLGVTAAELPDIECLTKLESFRCWGLNYAKWSTFPYSLKKLSMGSSNGIWVVEEEVLEKIGALPHLLKLKLERAQFQICKSETTQGQLREWKTSEEQFPSLRFLELKWCVLESWMTESSHFPRLEKLHLYAVKELGEIPSQIGDISTLQSIRLEYCSKSLVESAKKITEEQEELQVRVVLFNSSNSQALRSLASTNFLVEIEDF